MRRYRTFSWKDSNLRICSSHFASATRAAVQHRTLLEAYIERHPEFRTALTPIGLLPDAPLVARRMAEAACRTGVGPMAAVAGAIAQLAAEAALADGAAEAIVENGGDIYLASSQAITVGLYTGTESVASNLAFAVDPALLPLAVCSSSGRMGHSASLGDCDLATVVATSAALADAAATLACNLVRAPRDVDCALAQVSGIAGIQGVLLVKGDRVGLAGELPRLVKNADASTPDKVTRAPRSQKGGD